MHKEHRFHFFNFIFWDEEIDIQTETGQQIFQHELVHVKEKHTLDKLFIQLLLVVFWCNPFFWLIRRELKLIHEFIADKKAVGEYG
jgi:beta-lactamase regulating signal transducer with metallopeptidase domain